MGLSILSNIPSLAAQNELAMTNSNLQNTLFQLSSGSKINSGADDPAGLSIADGLQANISALTQSAQNVTDGVGMLQTADGALSQVTTLLNRAVTLATEAANTGLTSSQQNALQNEFSSISTEINQIGTNTTYNNTSVFSGAALQVFLSDGSQTDETNGPTISVNMPTLTSTSLGFGTTASATVVLTANPAAADTLQIGQDTYTFVAAGNANNANDVVIGNTVQDTLENLQSAVAGTPADLGSTIGTGTVANPLATITWVNGGSAEIQATTPGTGVAGNHTGNFVAVALNLATPAHGTVATSNTGFLGGGDVLFIGGEDGGGFLFKPRGDFVEHVVEPRGGQRREKTRGFPGADAEVAHVLFGGGEIGGHGWVSVPKSATVIDRSKNAEMTVT